MITISSKQNYYTVFVDKLPLSFFENAETTFSKDV